jgi:hypothetical protein
MAVIDVQMDRTTFGSLLHLQLTRGPVVPFPQLDVFGQDRLIASVSWGEDLQIVSDTPPGFVPRLGTLLIKTAVQIQHISVVELRADAGAQGTTIQGDAYLRVSATSTELAMDVAGLSSGSGPIQWMWPEVRATEIRLPRIDLVSGRAANLVADERVVSLRLLAGDGGAEQFMSPVSSFDLIMGWQIIVPRTVFTEMIGGFLLHAAKPEKNVMIEEGPSVSWVPRDNGTWGVDASVGIVKKDACPSPVFDDTDVSVDISVVLSFDLPVQASPNLVSHLRIEGDASDWDAFRCWLGTFGLSGLIYLDPPRWPEAFNIPLVIGSLIDVGNKISEGVAEEIQDETVDNFEKTGGQDEWAEFRASTPVPAIPDLGTPDVTFDSNGMSISRPRLALLPTIRHEISFEPPASVPLAGSWSPRINCSNRSMDWSYDVRGVKITDVVVAGPQRDDADVIVFSTTQAEPNGFSANLPSIRARTQVVTVTAKGISPGVSGRLYVHCSAGLRRYDITAAAPIDDPLREYQRRLINVYCDSLHVPAAVFDRTNLKWVTPPPEWNYGLQELRQWQVVMRNLSPRQTVTVVGTAEGRSVEIGTFVADDRGALVMDFVTPSTMEATVLANQAPGGAEYRMLQRWLLPIEILKAATNKRSPSHRMLVSRQARGDDRVVRVTPASRDKSPDAPVSLRGGRVLAKVGDKTVLALVHSSLSRR